MTVDIKKISSAIEHTLLKPDATYEQLKKYCEEAIQYEFCGVCVSSSNVGFIARILKGTPVMSIAVIGFPLGANPTSAKVVEAQAAVTDGAQEIDMVINIGALKNREYKIAYEDVRAVVEAVRPCPVKVILETGLLNHDEKVIGCCLAQVAQATFVKTSTGFGPGGATVEDIHLFRQVLESSMKIKASGGIRSYEDAVKLLEAGASRIGTSRGVEIVRGEQS